MVLWNLLVQKASVQGAQEDTGNDENKPIPVPFCKDWVETIVCILTDRKGSSRIGDLLNILSI